MIPSEKIMTARIYREVVNPGKLDETQRENLASELYAIHARIFHGVQCESFAREVIHSTARLTRIAIYRNRQQKSSATAPCISTTRKSSSTARPA